MVGCAGLRLKGMCEVYEREVACSRSSVTSKELFPSGDVFPCDMNNSVDWFPGRLEKLMKEGRKNWMTQSSVNKT